MIDLRPTSLCNVIYNMFAKILVNRIKPVSNSFIGDAQSVFVSNRLITDNILIAIEVFHWLIWGGGLILMILFLLKLIQVKPMIGYSRCI